MKTYAYDFVFSEGDTVKEKSEHLYEMISTLCVRKTESGKVEVRAGREIGRLLIVAADMFRHLTPKYEVQEDKSVFGGHIKRNCGSNGYCSDFDLYIGGQQTRDEILVRGIEEDKVVKIFNYPFLDEAETPSVYYKDPEQDVIAGFQVRPSEVRPSEVPNPPDPEPFLTRYGRKLLEERGDY